MLNFPKSPYINLDRSAFIDRVSLEYRLIDTNGSPILEYPMGKGSIGYSNSHAAVSEPMDKGKQLRFTLDAIEREEPVNLNISFYPSDIKSSGVKYVQDEVEYVCKTFDIMVMQKQIIDGNPTKEELEKLSKPQPINSTNQFGQKMAVIEMESPQLRDTKFIHWVAIDQDGAKYEVSGRGEGLNKEGEPYRQTLYVMGLDHQPEQLTLVATSKLSRYENLKWQFPIVVQ